MPARSKKHKDMGCGHQYNVHVSINCDTDEMRASRKEKY